MIVYSKFINSRLSTKQLSPNILKFEDDSDISEEVVSELNKIAEKITTETSWRKGDILMIDNTRILQCKLIASIDFCQFLPNTLLHIIAKQIRVYFS
ncbi:TauD/TfdA family dioxygenase [Nostoc sp. FACHB-888]|uniref:TauD/TfdA family dioxygenase n=1 Tax=Nostoc sp. FACHB-888 TaxID=2692842 RepID=UPI001F559560|nr:TauD/TfdA family dioxygenase [Nostoc sp. FACHB-888]